MISFNNNIFNTNVLYINKKSYKEFAFLTEIYTFNKKVLTPVRNVRQ